MILAILLCLLIAATPLAYAVYRAYKLAELERLCRSQWPSTPEAAQVIAEKHHDAVGEWWTASLSDDPELIVPGQTKSEAIENVMKKFEKLPQPDYEEIQVVYPADWKPGEE